MATQEFLILLAFIVILALIVGALIERRIRIFLYRFFARLNKRMNKVL